MCVQAVRVAANAQPAGAGLQTAVQSEQKDPATSEPAGSVQKVEDKKVDQDEYEGSCGPICEIARRQHLLDLNILYTVSEYLLCWLCNQSRTWPLEVVPASIPPDYHQ